jgi:hypothetical protein
VNPLFADSTFELVPIREENAKGTWILRYRDLRCFNRNGSLAKYLPRRLHGEYVHNDPDLENMTYGDVINSRSSALKELKYGDWVTFYALLTPYRDGKHITSSRRFGIVAAFKVDSIIEWLPNIKGSAQRRYKYIIERYGTKLGRRILQNAHTRRWLQSPKTNQDMRIIIVGDRQSIRFRKPIPLNRSFCERYVMQVDERSWNWKRTTELGTIGSYLRSIRKAGHPRGLIQLFKENGRNVRH